MRQSFNPADTLICVALQDELPPNLVSGWQVLYTGVGKVNASFALAEAWPRTRPKVIINFGTAGALDPQVKGLVRVTQFHQRDMDVRGLGFALGHTPFDDLAAINFGSGGLLCVTGDQFVMSPPQLRTDIVDMESYALAKYARRHHIEFHCYKYISDSADAKAATDWSTHVNQGASTFVKQVLRPNA